MPIAPPGLSIFETRDQGPVRVVYGAKQIPLGRSVQLVGLAPGVLSSSPLARSLEHEANVLSKLDHPNILRLFDLKHDDSQLWLVLEEVDGPTVRDLVKKQLPWQGAAAIGLDVCRALSHAHSLGETHGKLHPGNIQLTKNGRTKIFGFGQRPRPQDKSAEALEASDSGGLSPEGSIGQAVGPLSDLFALGALLYELLSGTPPFGDPADTHYASRVRHDREKPLLDSTGMPVPQALEGLISECLHKLPSDRPPNAQYVAQRLEELIGSATLPILRSLLGDLGYREPTPDELIAAVPKDSGTRGKRAHSPQQLRVALSIAAAVGASLASVVFIFGQRDDQEITKNFAPRDLPSEQATLLRVVASPWAHVFVDGEHRKTTPFAHPIALAPGKHVVRLEHPHAPSEERVIEGRPGQALLLNVQLHVERPLTVSPEPETVNEESP
jgi:serine/threonine protein kinase